MTLRVLDLFSGIGGFSLGLERAGMKTVAFCEIEPFCRQVLRKHWPEVPIYDDVRSLTADTLRRDGITVDVIAGGFPCQDLSFAGKRAGIEGERSGLWSEFGRLIRELRPQWAILENVPGILSAGAGKVNGELAASGYDCLLECIPATAVGAPHRRDRWWCIAYANGNRCKRENLLRRGQFSASRFRKDVADAPCELPHGSGSSGQGRWNEPANGGDVCNSNSPRLEIGEGERGDACKEQQAAIGANRWQPQSCVGRVASRISAELDGMTVWDHEPDIPRVSVNTPNRVNRLKSLGNSVVPQIPEMIGRAILESEVTR